MVVARIQCRNVMQGLPARIREELRVLHGDFLERFETICRESRACNIETLDALVRKFYNGLIGVRAQPLFASDARLER